LSYNTKATGNDTGRGGRGKTKKVKMDLKHPGTKPALGGES